MDAGRRECPHTFNPEVIGIDTAEVAGLNVPEFNDCQRFIIWDGTENELRYDSLFAIFAKEIANSIADSLIQHQGTLAFSAAAVYGYGDYEPLGISQGANCLIMWHESGERVTWHAMMAPRDATPNKACDDQGISLLLVRSAPLSTEGTLLSVVRQRVEPFASTWDYSGAARWGWSAQDSVQIAGIPCSGVRSGGAWCDVGPMGFGKPGTYHQRHQKSGVAKGWQRVTNIKGWHDEQLLALPGLNLDGLPRVSDILGTVIPDSQLVNRTFADWEEAAQVALLGPENQIRYYTRRFGFTATNAEQPLDLNKIFACRGKSCVSGQSIRGDCECPSGDQYCSDLEEWYAKVVSADRSETVYHRMCRYSMCDVRIPATARWRWLRGDEGAWFRCVDGCCELLGEEDGNQ
jgi:hypothetical protein